MSSIDQPEQEEAHTAQPRGLHTHLEWLRLESWSQWDVGAVAPGTLQLGHIYSTIGPTEANHKTRVEDTGSLHENIFSFTFFTEPFGFV